MAQNQPFALRSVLDSNKLNETNYADWICNLRIVLRAANKEDVLDNPLPEESAAGAPAAGGMLTGERLIYYEVSCLMLACMEPELQMQFENNHAVHDMIVVVRDMFQTQAKTERFNVSKAFAETKLAEGASVGPHVIKLVGYT